jgi:hypothetical protein
MTAFSDVGSSLSYLSVPRERPKNPLGSRPLSRDKQTRAALGDFGSNPLH